MIEKIKQQFKKDNLTLVGLKNDEVVITSTERGVLPLMRLLDSSMEVKDVIFIDKIVGKAAAFIYIKLGVKEIHCDVISESALEILEKNGVKVQYLLKTERILNRTHNGYCPMESATIDCLDADEAILKIRERLKEMNLYGAR